MAMSRKTCGKTTIYSIIADIITHNRGFTKFLLMHAFAFYIPQINSVTVSNIDHKLEERK